MIGVVAVFAYRFVPGIKVAHVEGPVRIDINAWNEPVGEYRNHTYQGVFIVSQPLYTRCV